VKKFPFVFEAVQDYAIFMLDPLRGHLIAIIAERIKGLQASEIVGQHFSALS